MAKRWLIQIVGVLIVFTAASTRAAVTPQQQPAGAQQQTVSQQRALVDQYCVGCHNRTVKTGGLALDDVDLNHVGSNAEVWERVVSKLRARYMPPVGRPRPSDQAYDGLISHMETLL